MVHAVLQRPVQVGEGFSAAREPHGFAEIIPPGLAVFAPTAHDAGLDGDSLTWVEIPDTCADRHDRASCLMTENEGVLDGEIPIPTLQIVVH